MNSIYRRLGGLAIALLMTPVLIGLLACMPVPIGDPERSRIDPELSGYWFMVLDEEVHLAVFEPYDKRTWLVRLAGLAEVPGDEPAEPEIKPGEATEQLETAPEEIVEEIIVGTEDWEDELDSYEAVLAALPEKLEVDDPEYYKVWRTKLGKYWYLTWEIKGEKDFEPDEWLVFRLNKDTRDKIEITMLYDSDELFGDVPETRRAYERVIRKHQDDPRLFGLDPDDDDEDAEKYVLYRIAEEDMSRFVRGL